MKGGGDDETRTRDLPALQAGHQSLNEIFAFTLFYFIFAFYGTCAVRVFLGVDYFPWTLGFRVLRSSLIMPVESRFYILCGTDVVGTILEALDYVNKVRHGASGGIKKGARLRSNPLILLAGTTRLELATSGVTDLLMA